MVFSFNWKRPCKRKPLVVWARNKEGRKAVVVECLGRALAAGLALWLKLTHWDIWTIECVFFQHPWSSSLVEMASENESKAKALVEEAEKKLNSSKSFLGGLFGWVCMGSWPLHFSDFVIFKSNFISQSSIIISEIEHKYGWQKLCAKTERISFIGSFKKNCNKG